MATDLFGKPIGGHPHFTLSLQQKRQATLLYHWMSLDYLKGLLVMIDALIKGADVNLELAKRQGRDALLTNARWGVRDTSANWSTHVYPALEDFKKSTLWHIAAVAAEEYGKTGAYQCARMISEFSSMWMTPDEEEAFTKQFEAVSHYAYKIDAAAGGGGQRRMDDFAMVAEWLEDGHLFPRLPKLRVRTDVETLSGKLPPRTGVYVAQDDLNAVLQFAWTGNGDGVLGDACTFNEVGRRMVASIGRDGLWTDDARMMSFAAAEMVATPSLDTGPYTLEEVRADAGCAKSAMSFATHTFRPCKWYYVEKIEGEYEDEEETSVAPSAAASGRLRCESGQPCPREGFWFTPAQPNSRRHFQQGEAMPAVDADYGATIWQWDTDQTP